MQGALVEESGFAGEGVKAASAVPDAELIRRRAAGEPLRQLAADYGVAHTTLGRYLARPQVKTELAQARRQLRAEQAARTSEWRRLEPEVRGRANEQAAREREQPRRFQLAVLSAGLSGAASRSARCS